MGPIGEFSLGKLTKLWVRHVLVNVKQNQGYNNLIPWKNNEISEWWKVNVYEYLYCILDNIDNIASWW